MYHGGNNPHSTLHTNDLDAPNTTLQESSFQPAGAANPMPSESYDFFAPLGEFGQPRKHYHMMRRLHLMLESWGSLLANTSKSMPQAATIAMGGMNESSLRWAIRVDGNDSGTEARYPCAALSLIRQPSL